MAAPAPKESFIIRHREPMWAYVRSQRRGTAHLNYVNKQGRRSLRLHIQLKRPGHWRETVMQVMVIIPLPLNHRLAQRIVKDGPINHRDKITWEKKHYRSRPHAVAEHERT